MIWANDIPCLTIGQIHDMGFLLDSYSLGGIDISLLTPQRNVLWWSQFVLGWVQRNSKLRSLDCRLHDLKSVFFFWSVLLLVWLVFRTTIRKPDMLWGVPLIITTGATQGPFIINIFSGRGRLFVTTDRQFFFGPPPFGPLKRTGLPFYQPKKILAPPSTDALLSPGKKW